MTKPRPDRGRHQARKRAVDLLFEAEARGITPAEAAESRELLAQSQSDVSALNPYTVTVARGVTQHAAHIDDLISTHLQGWTLERLPAVDRAILRVAVWELLHADDVPEPVAVDEAVELAKHLSTDDSPGFVNGVLGQVMLVTPQIRAAAAADPGRIRGFRLDRPGSASTLVRWPHRRTGRPTTASKTPPRCTCGIRLWRLTNCAASSTSRRSSRSSCRGG